MPPRARLDAELVRRKMFASREQAAAAIAEGRVLVAGQPARKAATAVTPDTPVTLTDPDRVEWASRGAHKLLGALEVFGDARRYAPPLAVAGRRCLDAGASTGGFTDVLLRAGAAGWSPSTSATARSSGGSAPTHGSASSIGPTSDH